MEAIRRSRKSNRWQKWDYSDFGFYFVTVCTHGRQCYFGDIRGGMMFLNESGKIAEEYFRQIDLHYKNVSTDEFIVMPNHVHGILLINNDGIVGTGQCPVPTSTLPRYGLLSKIINSYKNVVSKTIHKIDLNFGWQRSFFDHIIHTEGELERIRKYILNNPINWYKDRNNLNPENF